MLCDSGDIVVTNTFVVATFNVVVTCASGVVVVAASGVAVVVVPSVVAPRERPPGALAIAIVAASY